jgi:hypothetical protein
VVNPSPYALFLMTARTGRLFARPDTVSTFFLSAAESISSQGSKRSADISVVAAGAVAEIEVNTGVAATPATNSRRDTGMIVPRSKTP